jgi:hypothetical protein
VVGTSTSVPNSVARVQEDFAERVYGEKGGCMAPVATARVDRTRLTSRQIRAIDQFTAKIGPMAQQSSMAGN